MNYILGKIIEVLIPLLLDRLLKALGKEKEKWSDKREKAKTIKDMTKATEKLKKAKAKEERIRATKDVINGTLTPPR